MSHPVLRTTAKAARGRYLPLLVSAGCLACCAIPVLAATGIGGLISFSLSAPAAAADSPSQTELRELSIKEVDALIRAGTASIFDANPPDIYAKHHVPTATWVPYDKISPKLLPKDKNKQIVFYCAESLCTASSTAARQAIALGWTNVYVMPAGIFGWVAAKMPVEKSPAS
jgi:rhodanese-related sulfurtransferase